MRTEKRPPEREPLVLRRGKNFEAREKSGWIRCVGERLIFEKRVIDLRAKRGRLDIFVQSDSKMIGIGEVKATDWDNIRMGRVRALALRHVRQTWHYIEAHLGQLKRAREDGAPIFGYFYWSLVDNFEWAEGFKPRFGVVEVDYGTQTRRVRPSAQALRKGCGELFKER